MSTFTRKKDYKFRLEVKPKRFVLTARIRPKKETDHASSRMGEDNIGDFRLGE